ncbi:hypothetical protein CAL26_20865 [Bordetella genomosp. 9]|uniref:Uncharacterized protein n=1 Tax=Bordetella genomosp. 9 TaxID=1416803 RepID=A0A261R4R1_9BORD|nr:hypothetical protein [Bordetella genomosp. 9]OZI20008.1 hypothetical protein CAL26_20865 [Bordetella genomosp. 9]
MRAGNQDLHLVEGIQFRILAHVFPVLRHDALKPLSNAKLTIVLLEKAISKGTVAETDPPPFVGDLDTMLDDSVAAIRLLNNWFQDDSPAMDVQGILQECRRLAFSQLLLSGKKVQIDDFPHATPVAHRPSRYVLMAWMILAIYGLPERGVLQISQEGPHGLAARSLPAPPDATTRTLQPESAPPISLEDAKKIASFYGWKLVKQDGGWLLNVPAADHA